MDTHGLSIQWKRAAIDLFRQCAELLVFFFFLTTSLFLGDGKQPFVDVWWALGIFTMYGVRYYQRGKLDLRPLSRFIGWAWAALILYHIVLTPFSDSAGYSITATVRLIEAYLLYVMFNTITSERTIAFFVKGLLFVGVVATLASFVFLLVPSWTSFLPPMNLLYAAYGHNHLADLLLFTIPLANGMVERKRSTMTVGVLVLFLVGMALTLARGAWIILIGYLLFVFLGKKDTRVKVFALGGSAALVIALLLLSVVSANKIVVGIFQKIPQATRLLQKASFVDDGRWEYWRQAVEAIKERPLFGSGPGTFYLESKRLQVRPNSYSWFTHSFPLETTVEVGLVGALLLSLMFISSLRNTRASPLFAPLCLTLLYSFFEFNLDYMVVWLLLWATIGVLIGESLKPSVAKGKNYLLFLSIALLTCFYLASISGELSGFFPKVNRVVFPLISWQATKALTFLDAATDISPKEISINEFFHKANPEVLLVLANHFQKKDLNSSNTFFERAARVDSTNIEYWKLYMEFAQKQSSLIERNAVMLYLSIYGPTFLYTTIPEVSMRELVYLVDFLDHKFLSDENDQRNNFVRMFYGLGFSSLSTRPDRTKMWWTLARNSNPSWSYIHIELASLALYTFHDSINADEYIEYCKKFIDASEYCKSITSNTLPHPGSYITQISVIPRINN